MNDIKEKIDRLAVINHDIAKLQEQKKSIEAELIIRGTSDLENTKYKSIRYEGEKAKLTVTNAQYVKILYNTFLPLVFGRAYKDFVKEETTYKLTAVGTRLIQGLWKKEFVDATVTDVIKQITGITDEEKKQLIKKCKGKNYSGDVDNIMKFTSLSYEDACEYAFMITEAACWQEFCGLLQLNDIALDDENKINDLIQKIQSVFVVEDSTKLTLTEVG